MRAIDVNEETLGRSHDRVAKNCIALSLVYVERHKFAQAERLCRRAVKILDNSVVSCRKVVTSSSMMMPLLATALTQYAEVLEARGKIPDAMQHQRRALQIDDSALTTALEESMLAAINATATRPVIDNAAEAAHIRSLTRRVVRDLRQLSALMVRQGKLDQALELATRAVDTADGLLPGTDANVESSEDDPLRFPCISEHIDLAAALTGHAIALMAKGRLTEAAPIMGK